MDITFVNILLLIAISLIKLGQGFDFNIRKIFCRQNHAGIIKGVFVSIFLVPLFFLIIIFIFKPTLPITQALIVMAVCPAADLSIQQVKNLGGDVTLAAGVQTISALISIISIPVFLKIFEFILGADIHVETISLIKQIAVAQFIPMLIGLVLHYYYPNKKQLAAAIVFYAMLLLTICFLILIYKHLSVFAKYKWQTYFLIIFATVTAFILGVIFERDPRKQISLAIESSLRNPGLAYLIAMANFSHARAHTALIPYIVILSAVVVSCVSLLKLYQRHYFLRSFGDYLCLSVRQNLIKID